MLKFAGVSEESINSIFSEKGYNPCKTPEMCEWHSIFAGEKGGVI
jgi:hypothetical protein